VWDAKDLTGTNAAHIHFRVNQVRPDRKWAPSFGFALKRGTESVAVKLLGLPGKNLLVVSLEHSGAQPEQFLLPTQVSEENDLEIVWTPSGEVGFTLRNAKTAAVSANGEKHTGKLAGAPEMIEISSSTGELEVMSFALGTDAP
jgi:hypothetical protein